MNRHTSANSPSRGQGGTSYDLPPRRRHAARAAVPTGREDWDDEPVMTYDARERRTGAHRALADPDSLPPAMRRRRAYTLVGLTFVLPGVAQLVAGNRRFGRWSVRVWFTALVIGAAAGALALVKRSWLLGVATRSWVLFALAGLAIVLALVWLASFVDAARLARLSRLTKGTRRGVLALTALGVALTSGPLGWAASALVAGGSLIGTVFESTVSAPPAVGRYNILMLGGDSGAGRIGTRPDTIMLASVDAETGRTVTFGFARDTENIDFRPGSTMARLMPEGWNCGDECLLNGLYTWATENRDRFPADVRDPGALATKEAVEALSGLDIQYYVMVDLVGFRDMVNAVGGLDVVVKKRTPIGGGTSPISGYIEPGLQHLDGYHALWYARSREGSSNYERMARQKCVMEAATKQLDPQSVILRFQALAGAGKGLLRTDIPQGDLGGLADLALKSRSAPMKSVNFVPPLINPWDYDPGVIRRTVEQTIAAQATATSSTRPRAASTPGSAPAPTAGANSQPSTPVGTPGAGGATGGGTGAVAAETDICEVP